MPKLWKAIAKSLTGLMDESRQNSLLTITRILSLPLFLCALKRYCDVRKYEIRVYIYVYKFSRFLRSLLVCRFARLRSSIGVCHTYWGQHPYSPTSTVYDGLFSGSCMREYFYFLLFPSSYSSSSYFFPTFFFLPLTAISSCRIFIRI